MRSNQRQYMLRLMKTPDKLERWLSKKHLGPGLLNDTNYRHHSSLLMEAMLRNWTGESVCILLAAGCDVNVRCVRGTLLAMAVVKNNVSMVSKLISYGADVNLCDPLQHVHHTTRLGIIELLLRSGAVIHLSILHRVAKMVHNGLFVAEPILRMFVAAGGSSQLRDNHNRNYHQMWNTILDLMGGIEAIDKAEMRWAAATPGRLTKSAAKK